MRIGRSIDVKRDLVFLVCTCIGHVATRERLFLNAVSQLAADESTPFRPRHMKIRDVYVAQIIHAPPFPIMSSVLDVCRPLLIECSLIFQPLSITTHTRDLLTIIIRHRIRHTAGTRINPILLHSPIKLLLLLIHLRPKLPIAIIEQSRSHNRPSQPSYTSTCKSNQS